MPDGLDEDAVLQWLLGDWRDVGPSVCVLEGFSGIGKTNVAQRARRAWGERTAIVSAQESDDLENLLLIIASRLELDGCSVMANQPEGNFRDGLIELLRQDSLIVIDDFEQLLQPDTRLPGKDVMAFIAAISKLVGPGRVLLVTSETPADGKWMRDVSTKTMFPPSKDKAQVMLTELLHGRGLTGEVPMSRMSEVTAWLGRNPRAMEAFVACLREDPLDDLIQLDPEAWEIRDNSGSPLMIARLEERFVDKTIDRLDPAAVLMLENLSVYRRTFTIDSIRASTPAGATVESIRDALSSRFLLSRDRRWYGVAPIARHLALKSLNGDGRRRRQAHNLAADFYERRLPRRPAGRADSAGSDVRELSRYGVAFVEARYHLLQAGREADFQEMAGSYRSALLQSYRNVSDVPTSPTARQELLATLGTALHDVEGGVLASALRARTTATRSRKDGRRSLGVSPHLNCNARIEPD